MCSWKGQLAVTDQLGVPKNLETGNKSRNAVNISLVLKGRVGGGGMYRAKDMASVAEVVSC